MPLSQRRKQRRCRCGRFVPHWRRCDWSMVPVPRLASPFPRSASPATCSIPSRAATPTPASTSMLPALLCLPLPTQHRERRITLAAPAICPVPPNCLHSQTAHMTRKGYRGALGTRVPPACLDW